MAKMLFPTTIVDTPDDWNVGCFPLLADELRRAGHDVTTRNRDVGEDDSTLNSLDTGDGLSPEDAAGIALPRARRWRPDGSRSPGPRLLPGSRPVS